MKQASTDSKGKHLIQIGIIIGCVRALKLKKSMSRSFDARNTIHLVLDLLSHI